MNKTLTININIDLLEQDRMAFLDDLKTIFDDIATRVSQSNLIPSDEFDMHIHDDNGNPIAQIEINQ